MILTKEDLRACLAADNSWYQPRGVKQNLIAWVTHSPELQLKRYLRFLRRLEYHINTASGHPFRRYTALYYERRKNQLGAKLGIEISPNCFGKGLQIWHGNIVVNYNVRAGENCVLHGGNCIGNNGTAQEAPRLGGNVDIGYGAVLIGDIDIADGTVIGANAVVNRSVTESGTVVAGVPARKIHP